MSKRASIDEISDAIDSFVRGLPMLQKENFNKVYALLKDLSLDSDGNIKNTIANLKIIARVKTQLSLVVDNPSYQDKVSQLSDVISKVDSVQTAYFAKTFVDFTKPKAMDKLQEVTFDSTVDQLTSAGINENVVNHAASIVEDHITDGSSFSDMVEELKTSMLGDAEVDSKLISYAKQTINDTLSNYARNYHNIVTSDLELDWFEYLGSLVDSSRPVCIAAVHKKFFHRSELAAYARGIIDGVQHSRAGMYPGTTGETAINNAGGYQCSHQFIPIPASAVPSNLRRKFETDVQPDQEELADDRPKRKR